MYCSFSAYSAIYVELYGHAGNCTQYRIKKKIRTFCLSYKQLTSIQIEETGEEMSILGIDIGTTSLKATLVVEGKWFGWLKFSNFN